ncbi:EcoRII C terminal [Chromohalobacter canadensis]|uniref:EcoRII C terminal n=1 Tax=Chromohalobacter canadensis TaxID=141389 RepID=A0A285VIT1_9GAMM|nr:type II restriction endonuclease [Chromohalobacter canadensis]SOC54024.1 EcoRII C terminal [Chromohalobacter canadensis]
MKKSAEPSIENPCGDADFLLQLLDRAGQIFVKKLENNDRDWSYDKSKHQNGAYIPHAQRESGLFPALRLKERGSSVGNEIWEALFLTYWPQFEEKYRESRLVNYRSKGKEAHLTRIPKSAFSELLPASLLVIGCVQLAGETVFECLTLDSGSDEAALLSDIFNLDPDFKVGIFRPEEKKSEETAQIMDFAEELISAWKGGEIARFAGENAVMPTSYEMAFRARQVFMERHGLENVSPFLIGAPGDALREISRQIEWDIFREFQRRERAVELVRIVMGDEPVKIRASEIIRKLVDKLPAIDALMLSASQQRKSRAGYSYEHHIEAMLSDGQVPFEKQVILASKKRPDFILPSLKSIDRKKVGAEAGLILSAKTTLRERWKQVEREMEGRRLFLTTVDENIASSTIEDMASFGACLVIPESLRYSKETEYAGHNNVLSFREFCDGVIAPNLKAWRL